MSDIVPAPLASVQLPHCPNGSFLGIGRGHAIAGPRWCKSWSCPKCARKKARKLADRIARCRATRLLTLTMRPDPTLSPYEMLDNLNSDFRTLVKRLRRAYGAKRIEYVKIVEWTKKGAPHLHIALSSPYIPQATISALWREITGNSIVDIRRIRQKNGSGRYLAKYLTKSESATPGRRRWSQSSRFLPALEQSLSAELALMEKWYLSRAEVSALEEMLIAEGAIRIEGEFWLLYPLESSPPGAIREAWAAIEATGAAAS